MTSKTQAIWIGALSAVTGFLGWLATLPPETMTGMFALVVEIFPPTWRAQIGAVLKLISFAAGLYATHQAAKSGPQTPPPNPPK